MHGDFRSELCRLLLPEVWTDYWHLLISLGNGDAITGPPTGLREMSTAEGSVSRGHREVASPDGVAVVCAGELVQNAYSIMHGHSDYELYVEGILSKGGSDGPTFQWRTLEKGVESEQGYDVEDFVARDKNGVRTDAYHRLRASFGIERPPAREPDR